MSGEHADNVPVAWQRWAEQEIAFEVMYSKASYYHGYVTLEFLRALLPDNFDWLLHCGSGINYVKDNNIEFFKVILDLQPAKVVIEIASDNEVVFKVFENNIAIMNIYDYTKPNETMKAVFKKLYKNETN